MNTQAFDPTNTREVPAPPAQHQAPRGERTGPAAFPIELLDALGDSVDAARVAVTDSDVRITEEQPSGFASEHLDRIAAATDEIGTYLRDRDLTRALENVDVAPPQAQVPGRASIVYGAARELAGVRIGDRFVVYDSCVPTAVQPTVSISVLTGPHPEGCDGMHRALVSGRPYGRHGLTARTECPGRVFDIAVLTDDPGEVAAMTEALRHFYDRDPADRSRRVYAALYRHLTGPNDTDPGVKMPDFAQPLPLPIPPHERTCQ